MNFFTRTPDFSLLKRILIVRQDRLGDLILSLPLVNLIHQHYPDHQVDFLVPEYTRVVSESYVGVGEVLTFPEKWTEPPAFRSLVETLRSRKYDLALVPNTKSAVARLVYETGVPYRVGQGLRLHGWRYNLPVFQSRKMPDRNELDYNFGLLDRWLKAPERGQVRFTLQAPEADRIKVRQWLAEKQIDTYTIIHPGSGGSAVDIAPETLGAVIREYAFPGRVLLTGSAGEREMVVRVLKASQGKGEDVSGQFSLGELMALIQGCTLFLGNSTGPLHLARAFERPLLGFYSTHPACHPIRWGPYGQEENHTLLPPGEGFEGFEEDKNRSIRNMVAVTPGQIISRLDQLLGRAK